MDVFNKFYSSVSNTVSQLSGVLPGNPVTREFEATQYIASAGPGKHCVIYAIDLLFNLNTYCTSIIAYRFVMESL